MQSKIERSIFYEKDCKNTVHCSVLALAVIPLGMSFAESVKNKKSIEDKSAESNSTEDKSSIDDRLKNAIALYIGSSQAL